MEWAEWTLEPSRLGGNLAPPWTVCVALASCLTHWDLVKQFLVINV